ncbi:sulfotransferase 1 family member D1 [Gracilaria domingensis]|nr:sulfotransferase 1 family member D1 [Gracilaria domingensis]
MSNLAVRREEEVHRAALDALHALDRMRAEYPAATGLQSYKPRPIDVIIATNPKSGTTLLQHLLYQIIVAAGGAPDFDPDGTQFDDIIDVAPWVDYGPQLGTLSCESSPRLFKTHSEASKFDLNIGRFVFCARDPSRFVGSLLDFVFDHATGGSVTDTAVREHAFHLYVRHELLGVPVPPGENLFRHVRQTFPHWFRVLRSWTQTPRENILLLFYEDVVDDLPRAARELAAFVGAVLSEEDVARVAARCTREAMLDDVRFQCRAEGRVFGVNGAKKVQPLNRNGFNRFSLDEEEQALLADLLEEHTGYRSYVEWKTRARTS